MKYQNKNLVIPQNKRKDINNKCLYIIDNSLTALTQTDIFNAYTGEGGLHGLSYNDYGSFHAYTKAKQETEQGQFFTPHNICKFIVDCVKPSQHDFIADLCMGIGNFFNYLPTESNIYGCELDIKAYKVAKHLYPKANITADDIRYYEPKIKMDIVLGNPPFNLEWKVNGNEYLSQLYYFIKAHEILKPAGLMLVIVPNSFLNDEFSNGGMIKEINSMFNFVCQFDLPFDTFKNTGIDYFETKVMIFQKQSEFIENKPYKLDKININVFYESNANAVYNTYVKPLMEKKETIKSKLFLENLHASQVDNEFAYRVKKLLYDIKQSPKTTINYSRCFEYVNEYYTQKKPDGMKYEEWEKIKITKEKVIDFLSTCLKNQHKIERDKIELVKTSYGLKLKAYSERMQKQLNYYSYVPFSKMVIDEHYSFDDKRYYKLYQRKVKQYKKQSVLFADMSEDQNIKSFLDTLTIYDTDNDLIIRLNDTQKLDTNKMIQKQYGFLQWEQGAGKSISGVANMLYRLQNKIVKNVFVVSSAIAINNTWNVILSSYGYAFIRINCLNDINNIQEGQIVLITLNMLIKYQRQVKAFIKRQNQKIMLLFDESDNISNPDSKRSKAVLNCFRRVKYKTLMTGTSTRNNIVEIYPQLELLYNNSVNMISECDTIYELNKKENELEENSNPYYMQPIPAYREGFKLFSESHLPEKITVFGVGQFTQDIYNADVLKNMIDKTIITRTFEEVRGRKIYEIIQETVRFNNAEKELYRKVIEEFYSMDVFTSTGNLRKDRMLQILNQLLTMIKVCTIPDTYKYYESDLMASKTEKLIKLLNQWDNEYVAIGCRHIKVVNYYAKFIRTYFPDRPLFIITGEKVSLNKRKEIVKQLKATTNGILLSTQQSLSSSVNIGFVNKVLIPELSWNDATMSQYYARFARFDSVLKDDELKQIVFLTMENSIESNLLQLVMAKEKLNLFMKNQDIKDDELYEKYGVDFNLLDMLLSKEKDSEGKVHIRWGEQNIV